jgi:REP element-mobilizing transposase RayT
LSFRTALREAWIRVAGSLATIIGQFKSVATKRINRMRRTPGETVWQRNYYERVVRTEDELNHIRHYIDGNPAHWSSGSGTAAPCPYTPRRLP